MKNHLILISSPPSSQKFLTALNLSMAFKKQGETVSLCLLQDAVLGGLSRAGTEDSLGLAQARAEGIRCYSLHEDLAMRGYSPDDLPKYVRPVSYSELVDLLVGDENHVIGCF